MSAEPETVNPYESPTTSEGQHRSPLRALMTIVAITMLLNVRSVARNWSELTAAELVVGLLLWFVLPVLAVFLFWCGRAVGRWILVGLYGVRAISTLLIAGPNLLRAATTHPLMLLTEPLRTYISAAIVFGAAACALAFSPLFRRTPQMNN